MYTLTVQKVIMREVENINVHVSATIKSLMGEEIFSFLMKNQIESKTFNVLNRERVKHFKAGE